MSGDFGVHARSLLSTAVGLTYRMRFRGGPSGWPVPCQMHLPHIIRYDPTNNASKKVDEKDETRKTWTFRAKIIMWHQHKLKFWLFSLLFIFGPISVVATTKSIIFVGIEWGQRRQRNYWWSPFCWFAACRPELKLVVAQFHSTIVDCAKSLDSRATADSTIIMKRTSIIAPPHSNT